MFEEITVVSITVIAVSLSGVMAPGPLFATNIVHSLKGDKISGIKIAIGHTLVEFPLVVLIGIGAITFESIPEFKIWISIIGVITLFVFSALQIKQIISKQQIKQTKTEHRAIVSGIIFTGLNPFFIIWWLTVGLKIISEGLEIWSFSGIFIIFLLHIWLDYAWLGGTSIAITKIRNIISNSGFKIIMIGLCIVMTYYGVIFLKEGLTTI